VGARFHRRVQSDLDEILERYYAVSRRLGEDFSPSSGLESEKQSRIPDLSILTGADFAAVISIVFRITSFTTFEERISGYGWCDTTDGIQVSD